MLKLAFDNFYIMKKRVLTSILLILYCCISFAQESLGVFYQQNSDYYNRDHFNFNYAFGVNADFKLNQKWGIISRLGYEHNYLDLTNIYWIGEEYQPNYCELDIIKSDAHLYFNFSKKERRFSFYTFLGPTINLSIRQKLIYGNEQFPSYQTSNDIGFQSLNASFGLGTNIKLSDNLKLSSNLLYCTPVLRNWSFEQNAGNRLGAVISLSYVLNKEK